MTDANDVLQRLRERTNYGTHWDGCETEHDICAAIAAIEQLTAQIECERVDAERWRAFWAAIYIGELEEAVAAAKARIAELQRYVTDRDWQRAHANRLEIDVGVATSANESLKARIAELEANEAENDAIFADKDAEIERLTNLVLSVREERESLKAEVARLRSAWDWAKNVLADIGYNWRSIEEFDSAIDAARAQEGKG